MEEIKPKKEKRFLKAVGKVAGILLQEFVLGLGRKFIGKKIDRIGNKRQALLIFLALFCNIAFASIDSIPYPITGNKQRLGWQTTGNGLVWRGRSNDTITKPTNYVDKNVKAYLILDSVRGTIFVWRQTYWDSLLVGGGGLTMPFDSITFNTAKDGTVGVGEVEYNDTQGSLIQGLKGGNVTNVIGQQLHQRVNNRTGAPLAKGDVVYLSGSQGNRITVAKAIATSDPTSANTFGIVAESIADNASGYVITEGLITGLNTSALIQDSAVYLSGTTAGALTSIKPQAPIHNVYIGVCVKTNAGSGEVFVKIRNGQELDELHDVQITSPVNNSSLYYKSSEGLWRDTTAALLVSDTTSMLTPYLRKLDTVSLSNRINLKLNISDTVSMLTNYLRSGVASLTYTPLTRFISTTSPLQGGGDLSTNRTLSILSASDIQSGIVNTTAQLFSGSKVFKHRLTADSLFYLNNTSPIPTAILGIDLTGGVNSVGKFTLGNGLSITSSTLLADTNLLVTKFDTASMLTPYFRDADTTSLNLTSRFAAKLNISDTASMLTNYLRTGVAASTYQAKLNGTGFVKASGTTISYDNSTYLTTGTAASTYLTQSNAASTYLPLAGGTVSGTINRQEGSHDGSASTFYYNILNYFAKRDNNKGNQTAQITFTDRPGTATFENNVRTSDIYLMTAKNFSGGQLGQYLDTTLSVVSNQDGGRVGISKLNPAYKLDVNGTFNASGNSLIGGTLGVTGATTLSAPLTVNSSAVFNEGSADADFRVESDGNANMVFVDASTDRVGIGTNLPTKTLEVNGEVKISTTTATPTSLLGKDGNNVVGEVTTVAQTGLMKAGGTTANTSSVGIITVAHGLSYTPSQVIATVAQQNSYVIVCHSKDGTNMSFTVYDSVTGNALNNVSVGFFWLAIK